MPTTPTIHELEARIAALQQTNQALEARITALQEVNQTFERELADHQQLVEELRQSEAKFTLAFNCNAAVLSISTLKEGRYIEVNDAFCQTLGYTRAEVIGKTSQELNLWMDVHDRDRVVAALRRDGTVRNWDIPVKDKHGNRHDGIFSADLITVHGEPHLLVTVNDITERKRAERLLHIQRDLAVALNATSRLEEGAQLCLAAALEASGMDSGGAYVLTDATGDLDLITHTGFRQPAFVEMVRRATAGAPNHALVMAGKPIYSQYLLEARPLNAIRLSEGLQALALIPLQHEGQVIGSLNIASHTNPEVPAYARDVLESIAAQIGNAIARLKAETRLAQSEHAYRALTENALIGIFTTTRAGAFLYANPAMLWMTGYESLADLQQHLAMDLYLDVRQRDILLDRLTQTGQVENFEITLRTKHGQCRQVLISATQEGDQIAGTLFDISERKQAEAEIRRLNAELESRVKQRTAELEAANRELKDFAYIVSHDLKAPLRAISRLGQWLVDDYAALFDDKGKEMVGLLIQRVQRMDSLINGILEYSRVGRIVGETVPVDLNRLIQEVIEQIAPPPHIHIVTATPLPTLFVDQTRLFQVFQNLISNAVRFMDKPEGQITVGCVDEETQWRLSVTDNGPGIDLRDHERIFKIFQTGHARDELESTGVGLAIVKKIVEFYGGQVGVESTPGNGSRFWLTWPKSVSI